jgi:hypothetical protein
MVKRYALRPVQGWLPGGPRLLQGCVGLVCVCALAAATPTASAGPRVDAPTLAVHKAAVSASWNEGWLRAGAAVRFSGSVSKPSVLTAFLRPIGRGGVTARLPEFEAGPGAFHETLTLPPRALPGRYRLRVLSKDSPSTLKPVDVIVRVPAPPEGVVARALVGPTRQGPWLRYVGTTGPALSGQHTVVWVRFRFLYPPTGRHVQLVWKLRWHTLVGKVYRRYENTLDTYARSSDPLPKGTWLVVLKINGRVAKRMDVKLR